MIRVLYPGSFDPITKGHMNIIKQASELFDEVYIGVFQNSKKNYMFSPKERVEMIKELYQNKKNIKVILGETKVSTVNVAEIYNCQALIRGLRSLSDYDYEVQLQQINKEISCNGINTICFFADKEYQFVSSSVVKELFNLKKDISRYVDSSVKEKMLVKRLNK